MVQVPAQGKAWKGHGDRRRYDLPLLARLRRQGLVETTWRESAAGPPRRYYRIAPAGREALAEFTGSWRRLRDSVDDLLASSGENPFQERPAP